MNIIKKNIIIYSKSKQNIYFSNLFILYLFIQKKKQREVST
jgi:hypothetical protein